MMSLWSSSKLKIFGYDANRMRILGPVDKLDSQARQNLIQDSFCGVYLGAFADGGCRVGVL